MPEKNKPYAVKITETAWEMFVSHARFLANVSVPAANRLIDTFVEVTDSLTAMLERNPWLEHDAIPFQYRLSPPIALWFFVFGLSWVWINHLSSGKQTEHPFASHL